MLVPTGTVVDDAAELALVVDAVETDAAIKCGAVEAGDDEKDEEGVPDDVIELCESTTVAEEAVVNVCVSSFEVVGVVECEEVGAVVFALETVDEAVGVVRPVQ